MKSLDSLELRQGLLEILRAGVAANEDQEAPPVCAGAAAATREEALKPARPGAPQAQRQPYHSTELPEPGPEGTP